MSVGGPFGREKAQTTLPVGLSMGLDYEQTIEQRQQLWDDCRPWTEGLRCCSMLCRRSYSSSTMRSEMMDDEPNLSFCNSPSCKRLRTSTCATWCLDLHARGGSMDGTVSSTG